MSPAIQNLEFRTNKMVTATIKQKPLAAQDNEQ